MTADQLSEAVTEEIRAAMRRRKVNQAELARRITATDAYVSQLLAGRRNMTLATLAVISEALDCNITVRLTLRRTVDNNTTSH